MRILYLDLDALNPSHLGCYGYHRNTSPTIDRLAGGGVRLTNCYASDAPCLPSRTAFCSGRFGIQTGVVGHAGTAAQPKNLGPDRFFNDSYLTEGLAGRLQKAGFHTAMISPFGQRHAAWHFYAGFKEIHNTGKGGMESAEEVMPAVDRWLDTNAASDQWFLHLNFWDIHTPYRAPAEYGNPFENEPVADWFTDDVLAKHIKKTGPHSASDLFMYRDTNTEIWPRVPKRIVDRETLKQWIDGYDTAIRYVDDKIQQIIDKLKAAGVYDDTVIIISADHGENQGDLGGIYGEHGTADHATCHIPMIVRWPNQQQNLVAKGLHYNLDLAPTLMQMIGQESPDLWDGKSFADTLTAGQDVGHDELIVSQCAHVCQRSVRFENWIYIRTYHDGFHLFDKEMLFDLEADPHEQNNLASQHPELCKEGLWRLMNWHDQQMIKMVKHCNDVVDPLWTVMRENGPFHAQTEHLRPYLERLKETGRADGAARLAEKYATELAAAQ